MSARIKSQSELAMDHLGERETRGELGRGSRSRGRTRRCWPGGGLAAPGPETEGQLSYRLEGEGSGAFVAGTFEGKGLACEGGGTARFSGSFRAAILDVR